MVKASKIFIFIFFLFLSPTAQHSLCPSASFRSLPPPDGIPSFRGRKRRIFGHVWPIGFGLTASLSFLLHEFLRGMGKFLLAAHGAKIVRLPLVFVLGCRLLLIHGHAAYWIDSHNFPFFLLLPFFLDAPNGIRASRLFFSAFQLPLKNPRRDIRNAANDQFDRLRFPL
jgi:hypothetical protein